MALNVEVFAAELDTMTVQDLDKLGRLFSVKDKENLSAERWERLRSLIHQRDREAQSSAVDADMLSKKLSQIPRRSSPSLSECSDTTAPPPTQEERIAFIYQAYDDLIELGGTPSAPINPDPGPCPPSKSEVDKEYHISDHWGAEEVRVNDELERWKKFREYQQAVRRSLERFNKYTEEISSLVLEEGIKWAVNVQIHSEQQTKLDEWKEYYLFECTRRRDWEKKLERILQQPEVKRDPFCLSSIQCRLICQDPWLEMIKQQIPDIAAESAVSSQKSEIRSDLTDQEEVQNAEPLSCRPAPRSSQPKPSVLAPVHSSRVSKVSQSGRQSLKKRRGILRNARKGVLSPTTHSFDGEQLRVQSPPKGPLRRSARISKRECTSTPASSDSVTVPEDRPHTTAPLFGLSNQSRASSSFSPKPVLSKKRKFESTPTTKSSHQGPGIADDESRKRTRRSYSQPIEPFANIRPGVTETSGTEGKILRSTGRHPLGPSTRGSFGINKQTRPPTNNALGPVHSSKVSKSAPRKPASTAARIEQVSKGVRVSITHPQPVRQHNLHHLKRIESEDP
ncbi:hypothetical protein MMC30_002923 [Trapelia coarctata]|nr:hypothetical protein [Trapelia coarctata]